MAGIRPAANAPLKNCAALKIFSESSELPESKPDFLPEKAPNEQAAFHNLHSFIKNSKQEKIYSLEPFPAQIAHELGEGKK